MRRLKLRHGYHDAIIRSVEYREDEDIILTVDLCGCCNPSPGQATLTFRGIRNFEKVRSTLEAAREENKARGYLDEIIGIVRNDVRGYLLDLATARDITVDAKNLLES